MPVASPFFPARASVRRRTSPANVGNGEQRLAEHTRPSGDLLDFVPRLMPPDDKQPHPEREHTDESLRVEREKADHAHGEEVAAIDELADAVIGRARARADKVLAAARAKSDRKAASPPPGAQSPGAFRSDRAMEDRLLQAERANADETLREERAEHVALLSAERKETDADLLRERARSDDLVATRDEFLGIVSHDLRSMLNAVVGSAVLIAKELLLNAPVERVVTHAQRIQRSGGRMDRLIGDLLDVASIEAGALVVARESADPTQVVTEAVETFQAQASAKGIALSAEIVSPPSLAAFDFARILQVLTNLLSNAIKFTPTKGTVVVRVECTGDEMQFAVRDTGAGIPADKLEAVFVRFLQVGADDRRGVGLGLYISRCIVQGHSGRIWAESKLGAGSTVFFTLPVHVAT